MQTEIFWSILGGGALCTGLGLLRSLRHYRQWQQTRSEQAGEEGEVVLAERCLQVGQQATLTPSDQTRYTASDPIPTQIVSLQKRIVTFQAERPFSTETAGTASLPPETKWPVMGATAVVMLTGEDAMFRFTARVCDVDSAAGSVKLSRPFWIARVQRRRYFRVPVQFPVTLEPAVGASTAQSSALPVSSHQRPQAGIVTNLSGGGFRLQFAATLSPGELADLLARFGTGILLWVRLPLPALNHSPLLVRVCTARRIAVRGGLSGCLTCEFVSLQPWEEDLIVQHLFRIQREQAHIFPAPALIP